MAAKKATTKTEPEQVKDSRRVNVIVTRKFSEHKTKIFASTTIIKNGKSVLEQFRIPVDTPVSLPIEIARILKDRKIAKFVDNKQAMVPEFLLEKVETDF